MYIKAIVGCVAVCAMAFGFCSLLLSCVPWINVSYYLNGELRRAYRSSDPSAPDPQRYRSFTLWIMQLKWYAAVENGILHDPRHPKHTAWVWFLRTWRFGWISYLTGFLVLVLITRFS